jgi:hypothetical protein
VSVVVSSVVSLVVIVLVMHPVDVEQSVVTPQAVDVAQLPQLKVDPPQPPVTAHSTMLPPQLAPGGPPTGSSGEEQAAKVTAPTRTKAKISVSSRCIDLEDSAPAPRRWRERRRQAAGRVKPAARGARTP